jgi:hypothetical protein
MPIDSGTPDTGTPIDSSTPVDTGTDSPMLMPCPSPVFMPAVPAAGMTVPDPTNVIITAPGLPDMTANPPGYICYTTGGMLPNSSACTPYSAGMVGIPISVSTDFKAISTTLGKSCTDSPIVEANYMVAPPPPVDSGGPPAAPQFSMPTTGTNAYTANITESSAGAIICYTFGTTAPTCTVGASGATCDMGTATFNGPIAIGPSTMQTALGQVEIQAMACSAGGKSAVVPAQYTLQVATPTMSPSTSPVTWSSTLTGAFQDGTTGAQVYYTADGSTPTCTPGGAVQVYTAPFALKPGTYNAIACAAGYEDSVVGGPFTIAIDLTPPTITPASSTGPFATTPALAADNSANPNPGSWLCWNSGATPTDPTCGATANTCGTGNTTTVPTVTDQLTVKAVACAVGYTGSTASVEGPYTLQLPAPLVLPDTQTTAATTYAIPATDPAAGGHLAHLNISFAATGQTGGYMCWIRDAGATIVPACGPTSTCLNGSTKATTTTDLETLATFAPGDSVSVITCPGTTAGTGQGFEASTVYNVSFSGAGQVPAPTISSSDGINTDVANPWHAKVTPLLVNLNSYVETICYTIDGSDPTCTVNSTTGNCATVDGIASQNVTFDVTSAGSGYINPPTVAVSYPVGANCTGAPVATMTGSPGGLQSLTISGCSGFKTVGPTVVFHTGTGAAATGTLTESMAFTVTNGGAGYTTAPKVTLVSADGNGGCTVAPTANLNAAGEVTTITGGTCNGFTVSPSVTFDNAGTNGAGAFAQVINFAQNISFVGGITAGNYYTVAPVLKQPLTPGSGAGTCTSVVATLGTGATAGQVTAVTATGCTGFSDTTPNDIVAAFQVQGPADGTAQVPTVTSVLQNALKVAPPIETATTLKAIACATGLTTSPVIPQSYTFAIAPVTCALTDNLTGANAAPPLDQDKTLTCSTQSNFSDLQLVYSNDGLTTPDCTAGKGTFGTTGKNSIVIAQLDPAAAGTPPVEHVNVIACGANQTKSALLSGPINVAVAGPVIDTMVGPTDLGNIDETTAGGVSKTLENSGVVTITSPTANTYLCYSTAPGDTPVCATTAAGCTGGTSVTKAASPATVNVTTSGEAIKAVACEGTAAPQLSSAVTGPYNLTLQLPAVVVVGTPNPATCPSTVNVGFDSSNLTNTSEGGPTTGATVCWSTAGPTGAACVAAGPVQCFQPASGAWTTPVSATQIGLIFYVECKAGYGGNGQQGALLVNVNPETEPTIRVDGLINASEWSASDTFASDNMAYTGGFTLGATTNPADTIFLMEEGFTSSATTVVDFYLVDANGGAPTRNVPLHGGGTLPFPASRVIEVNTTATGGTTCAAHACVTGFVSNAGGTAWNASGPLVANTTASVTANALEFSIPENQVIGTGTHDPFKVAGVVVNTVTTTPAPTGAWPQSPATATWSDVLYNDLSCTTPSQDVQ